MGEMTRVGFITAQSAVGTTYPHVAPLILTESRYDISAHRIGKTRMIPSPEPLRIAAHVVDPSVVSAYPETTLLIPHYWIDKPVGKALRIQFIRFVDAAITRSLVNQCQPAVRTHQSIEGEYSMIECTCHTLPASSVPSTHSAAPVQPLKRNIP